MEEQKMGQLVEENRREASTTSAPPARRPARDRAEPPTLAEWRVERDARWERRAALLARADELDAKADALRETGDTAALVTADALASEARKIRHGIDFTARPLTPKPLRPACGANARSKGRPCRVRAEWDEERDEPTTRLGRCRFHGGCWRKGLETKAQRKAERDEEQSLLRRGEEDIARGAVLSHEEFWAESPPST